LPLNSDEVEVSFDFPFALNVQELVVALIVPEFTKFVLFSTFHPVVAVDEPLLLTLHCDDIEYTVMVVADVPYASGLPINGFWPCTLTVRVYAVLVSPEVTPETLADSESGNSVPDSTSYGRAYGFTGSVANALSAKPDAQAETATTAAMSARPRFLGRNIVSSFFTLG
jgi:hypothetical protein